jgi:hypothetical protein
MLTSPRDLAPRRRVLFTMLTALDFRGAPGQEPAVDTDAIRKAAMEVQGRKRRPTSRMGDLHTLETPGI